MCRLQFKQFKIWRAKKRPASVRQPAVVFCVTSDRSELALDLRVLHQFIQVLLELRLLYQLPELLLYRFV
jgi:hypothetical protein